MRLVFRISQAFLREKFDRYPYMNSPEIKSGKLCQHPIRFVLKSGIKMNPKHNALSGFKLLSLDSVSHIPYKIHTRGVFKGNYS